MSKSIVYKISKPSGVELAENIFVHKLITSVDYTINFFKDNPEVKGYQSKPTQFEDERIVSTSCLVNIDFPNQELLDKYLSDNNNLHATFISFLEDSEVKEYCETNNISQTLTVEDDTDKTDLVNWDPYEVIASLHDEDR